MLVYFTVILVVLLGFCGLATDVGRMELRTIQLQAAADDAALTAAAEVERGNYNTALTLTTAEVSAYLTQAGLPSATVTAQAGPSAGPYSGDNSTVQVTITQQMPIYFMALLMGRTTTTITAKALAMVPPCALFQDFTNSLVSTYTVWLRSAQIDAACPAYVKKNMDVDGFAYFGDSQVKLSGSTSQNGEVSGGFTYPAVYNAPSLPDPLAYITAPSSPATLLNCTRLVTLSILVPTTIYPGTYCGGITVAGGATVTMSPGLYIITGGMSITAGSTLTGTGVTIYLTKGAGFGYGTFSLVSSTFNVSAPTDATGGGIPGIVLFGDRNWAGGQYDFILNYSTYRADGIIYTTNTGITLYNTYMTASNYMGIQTAIVYEFGSRFFPVCNYSVLPGGNPFHMQGRLLQ